MQAPHSSKSITGSKGHELAGKRVCLGITGSVAAARSPELARELMRHGAEVFCVMSRSAQELVGPQLMHWATGNPVVTGLTGECEHISLCGDHSGKADLLLIAPCTANTIGKIAWGIDDTPVTTCASTALGAKIPIVIVPAMHQSIYDNPFVGENLASLGRKGVHLVMPRLGEGKAKIAENADIVDYCIRAVSKQALKGKKVLVTAGATREFMDDVRFISNPSSGRMGIALAREAWLRGAEVTLVSGHIDVPAPGYLKHVEVVSAAEMLEAVGKEAKGADFIALSAAAGDFAVEKRKGKLGSGKKVALGLVPAQKISDNVKKWNPKAKLVLFKAESGVGDAELARKAKEKMAKCGADLIVANDVSRKGAGFGTETNEVLIIGRKGKAEKVKGAKAEIAVKILDAIS